MAFVAVDHHADLMRIHIAVIVGRLGITPHRVRATDNILRLTGIRDAIVIRGHPTRYLLRLRIGSLPRTHALEELTRADLFLVSVYHDIDLLAPITTWAFQIRLMCFHRCGSLFRGTAHRN